MLTHTSAYSAAAPSAAAAGSWVTVTRLPRSAWAPATCPTRWWGESSAGVATATSMPAFAPSTISEWATLLPSPT